MRVSLRIKWGITPSKDFRKIYEIFRNAVRIGFDNFVFDSGKRELTQNGDVISISPKAFRLLELLLVATPEAISRELVCGTVGQSLRRRGEPAESDLRNPQRASRRFENSRYIRTAHRFGYRSAEMLPLTTLSPTPNLDGHSTPSMAPTTAADHLQ
jgi:hypothetical protein